MKYVFNISNEDKERMETVMGEKDMKKLNVFFLKHPLNGWFVVFQVGL